MSEYLKSQLRVSVPSPYFTGNSCLLKEADEIFSCFRCYYFPNALF